MNVRALSASGTARGGRAGAAAGAQPLARPRLARLQDCADLRGPFLGSGSFLMRVARQRPTFFWEVPQTGFRYPHEVPLEPSRFQSIHRTPTSSHNLPAHLD